MKKKQKDKIRNLSSVQLLKLAEEKRLAIKHAQFKKGEEKNTNTIRLLQHDLAFIYTVQKEHEAVQAITAKKGGA